MDTFFPQTGEATLRLLSACGLEVDFPREQTCCGQPAFNSGHWDDCLPVARRWLEVFAGSESIVTPSGSCAAMVRHHYPHLFAGEASREAQVRAVGERLHELSELLDVLPRRPWRGTRGGSVTYHHSCHLLRGLRVGEAPQRLLVEAGYELVEMEGAEVCCGFGGTFALGYPGISTHMARRKLEWIADSGAGVVVTADSGCRMQLAGALRRTKSPLPVVHLAEALAP